MATNDGLLEINMINVYKIYENLSVNLELGYIANFYDNDTWKRDYQNFGSFQKQDDWKAQLVFCYDF